MVEILKGPSLTKHQNPKKLMIMLHGYGDNATNFIQIANLIDQDDFEMKYVALNAPDTIQDYPMGYEWFQLYLNGTHISNASAKEYDVAKKKISENVEKIYNSISLLLENLNLTKGLIFSQELMLELTKTGLIGQVSNFMPKFWLGHYSDLSRTMESYDKNKRKPRILYSGSGAHFDVENRVKFKDDFYHVNDVIRKTIDKYTWVFLGAHPLPIRDLVQSGKVEFHPWKRLFEYGKGLFDLNVNMIVAPLQDNTFNKAKSDLKYIEACALGLPIACQDLCTYDNAPIKFKTGDEMIAQIETTLKDRKRYKAICKKARQYADTRWLEDDRNIDCYLELYQYGVDDPKRINLGRYN